MSRAGTARLGIVGIRQNFHHPLERQALCAFGFLDADGSSLLSIQTIVRVVIKALLHCDVNAQYCAMRLLRTATVYRSSGC